jgi:hypothetical protein
VPVLANSFSEGPNSLALKNRTAQWGKRNFMKISLLVTVLTLVAGFANAANYNCKLTNGEANDPKAVSYSFDTVKENNKFVDLGQGTAVGCIVLRAQTQLLTCGLGNGANFSVFSTADDGTSVLGLQTDSNGSKANLTCIKSK